MTRFLSIITAIILGVSSMWGTSASDIIAKVKNEYAPDARQVVFEATLKGKVLRGVTSEPAAKAALVEKLKAAGISFVDSMKVYPADEMGLVSIPAASLRTRAAHAGEMATQAVMGTPVRILETTGDWRRVQTPDGYIAYVPKSSVEAKTKAAYEAWLADTTRMVVTELWQTHAFRTSTSNDPRDVVTDLVLGAIVEADGPRADGRIHIVLPDGRQGWADDSALTPIAQWADQPFDAQKILTTAYSMEGSPYLWGGTSSKAVDCSGMVKVSYLNNGLILRRDASQQALTGTRLEASEWRTYQPGDLLFFGGKRVTHVGVYDSDGKYVHSSGRVKRNSLDPDSPAFLYSPLWAVRIHGNEGTEGIVRAIDHPWYFKK